MGFALGPSSETAGYGLLAFDEIGSTNAEALSRAGQGGPLWVVSDRQTAGRGRRGKVWETPRGNLAASLLLTLDMAPPKAATLGFVAGLALNRAVAEAAPAIAIGVGGLDAPRARLTLKWPNDVLADGAKLAGILLEVAALADGRLAVVIGLGVNVVAAPQALPYPATSLAALGAEIGAQALFLALSDTWLHFYRIWDGGRGLPEIRRLWLAEAAGLGAPVAVHVGGGVLRGRFETLDEEGRLIVMTDDGMRKAIAAGEVHFGGAGSLIR